MGLIGGCQSIAPERKYVAAPLTEKGRSGARHMCEKTTKMPLAYSLYV